MSSLKSCGKLREGKSLQDTSSAHDTSRNPRLLSNRSKRTQFLQLYFNYMSNHDKNVFLSLPKLIKDGDPRVLKSLKSQSSTDLPQLRDFPCRMTSTQMQPCPRIKLKGCLKSSENRLSVTGVSSSHDAIMKFAQPITYTWLALKVKPLVSRKYCGEIISARTRTITCQVWSA